MTFTNGLMTTMLLASALIPTAHAETWSALEPESKNEIQVKTYRGSITMAGTGTVYEGQLEVGRILEEKSDGNPTETVSVPRLEGSLRFPVLEAITSEEVFSKYDELINPMGRQESVVFDMGDFDPRTKILLLPYAVAGYGQSSEFGRLSGALTPNGHFIGKWTAKPMGIVATFDLILQPANTAK